MDRQATCAERVRGEYESTMADLRLLWEARGEGDGYVEDLGSFEEYHLCFDYVAPGTSSDQDDRGYFRYQLSWGGPSDEFRFYVGPEFQPYEIAYWFLDWFDGARTPVHKGSEDWGLLVAIFDDFDEMDYVRSAYAAASETQ